MRSSEIEGPAGTLLLAIERTIRDASSDRTFHVIVAEDHRDVQTATRDFAFDLLPSLGILAVVLVIAAWAQIAVGLLPLERLRRAVSAVVSGRATRLNTIVPSEVQPLADEINRLLDSQEKVLAKARTSAADLAHGLKTPLQVLAADVRTLREQGQGRIADEIDEVAGTIRRHVERELARARIAPEAAAKALRSGIAETAERVISVVKRTPQGEPLAFSVNVPPGLAVAVDETDLAEILGNLIENASRYAMSRVSVRASQADTMMVIAITDDGPGIPDNAKTTALERGARVDLRGTGTGLGLAIVSDVVDAYGGTFGLEDAKPGLRAVVSLPRAR